MVRTEHSNRLPKAYRSLFSASGTNGLARLRCSRDDSIAIQAAWEEVALTIPEAEDPQIYRPDKEKLNWFIGFLEGRLNIAAPKWWANLVLDARARRRSIILLGQPTADPYHKVRLKYVTCPRDTTVEKSGDSYIVAIGADSVTLPDEMLLKSDRDELLCNISACFVPEYCFVAVHTDLGYPHDVACIDRSSGKLKWKAEACGCFFGFGGRAHSWVSVSMQGDRVFVFGAGNFGFYVHAFRTDNGNTVFRFSSNF